ncbi:fumarate hydratase subunit beta [Desulfohalotomaculum tongense]|uniref:Fe-S-containing hydro-lyase n=1 Tax=Desulforadius tongensis TaxID=1216062 RepID=UPI00195B79F1|nr:Fe-S-containing hydro-lyase [Desulforadius tongensis]MBM7854128.1 fumarate hydratase subunit beta [Desulforadius tongensis]
MDKVVITTPLTDDVVQKLRIGQQVLINGRIFTGRDAAHKRLVELLANGKPLPVDFTGQIIYYVGPTPAKPGQVIGAAGPTTAGRMDAYTPQLLEQGLKGMIGKGKRSPEVIEAIKKHKAVYFAAIGGAAALISKKIKSAKVIAYPELGPEAIYELEVEDFPAIVVNDAFGGDLYQEGTKIYAVE